LVTKPAIENFSDIESQIKDYISLLKPRVMSLVVFTGMAGIYLAPGHIHPLIAIIATLCIALGSGAAGAINMWYERDVDALMKRTKNRPLPGKRMYPQSALEFAIVTAAASVFIMSVAVNFMSGFLLLIAILFYVFIYTIWLKRRTPQNIVIGGAAGAFPPVIGWAAVTGSVSIESISLFMIIFLWTPPHFWSLALYKNDDYKAAGIPMLPVVAGELHTRKMILAYTMVLLASTLFPLSIGMFGLIYGIGAVLLGVKFLEYAHNLYKEYSEELARKMFKYSIMYLFALFILMIIDKAVS
jgi:protoheme IX farnesyltransferase